VGYEYFYLSWTLFFLLVWVVLFAVRKDLRVEMLFISVLFGFGGILSQQTHIRDWWQPLTITNTPLGIEDFLIGFAIGGIASVIYAVVFWKRNDTKKASLAFRSSYWFLLSFALLFLGLFYVVGLNSFYAATISYIVGIAIIVLKRSDLVLPSIGSGFLMLAFGMGTYYALFLFFPSYIHEFWYLSEGWYSTLVFGVPLGEYVWYFLTGAFIGPLFEFVQGVRFKS